MKQTKSKNRRSFLKRGLLAALVAALGLRAVGQAGDRTAPRRGNVSDMRARHFSQGGDLAG